MIVKGIFVFNRIRQRNYLFQEGRFVLLFFIFIFYTSLVFSEERSLITAIEKVAQDVGPTVVSIKTERVEHYRKQSHLSSHLLEDDILSHFLKDFYQDSSEFEERRTELGSGVIIDKKGHILTNEHVVKAVDRITVILPDGRSFEGTLKGADSRSNLAVIKIYAPKLPVAKLGDSDELKVGQWVIAMGNPFGHIFADPTPTVTSGIISALHRSLPRTSRRDTDFADLIQTDAAINPGNSGGPLVNIDGEVIGINMPVFSNVNSYQGMGFAIPINYAREIINYLIRGEKVLHGWIGINIQDLDYRLVQYFGLNSPSGVVVVKILEDSPAQKAGLVEGDIILTVNGEQIHNSTALIKYIEGTQINNRLALSVWRNNIEEKILVKVAEHPYFDVLSGINAERDKIPFKPQYWRGLKVGQFSEILANRLKFERTKGIVIIEIDKKSPAFDAGLRKNDIIISINKAPVEDILDFNNIIRHLDGNCLVRTLRGYFVVDE